MDKFAHLCLDPVAKESRKGAWRRQPHRFRRLCGLTQPDPGAFAIFRIPLTSYLMTLAAIDQSGQGRYIPAQWIAVTIGGSKGFARMSFYPRDVAGPG